MPTDKWMDKENVVYDTVDYNSALKEKKILYYTTTWMNMEDIKLNKIGWSHKDKYCMISLIQAI